MNATHPELLAETWTLDGFVCIDLGITEGFCGSIRTDIDNAPEDFRSQKEYERGGNARILHGWKYSDAIRELALHPKIMGAIRDITRQEPFPFQTLNFSHGTQQPLHQDSIHFDGSNGMVGVWVALEDISEDSGPLIVCPGSHKEPRWDLCDLGWNAPRRGKEQYTYRKYERFIAKLACRYDQVLATIPRGHALIWQGNVIHGGSKVTSGTRYSQATHYLFDGGEYSCPMFEMTKDVQDLRAA